MANKRLFIIILKEIKGQYYSLFVTSRGQIINIEGAGYSPTCERRAGNYFVQSFGYLDTAFSRALIAWSIPTLLGHRRIGQLISHQRSSEHA